MTDEHVPTRTKLVQIYTPLSLSLSLSHIANKIIK